MTIMRGPSRYYNTLLVIPLYTPLSNAGVIDSDIVQHVCVWMHGGNVLHYNYVDVI